MLPDSTPVRKWKVCVYMIAKNEENFVDRVMDSIADADLVVVGDTGSTDNTVQKFKDRGATVHSLNLPGVFRYDTARNAALDLVPEDIDICVSLDCDEVLADGWYEDLQENWTEETTNAFYLHNYTFDHEGNVTVSFYDGKIHARSGYRWKYPIHEVLHRTIDAPENTVELKRFVNNHYPKPHERPKELYLHELTVEEHGDARSVYKLLRLYYHDGMYRECLAAFKRLLAIPGFVWDLMMASAYCTAAQAYIELGDKNEAKITLFAAIVGCPAHYREHYYLLAKLYFDEMDYKSALHYLEKGLEVEDKDFGFSESNYYYGNPFWAYAAICAHELGQKDKAIEYGKKALEFSPDDEVLTKNLNIYMEVA